LRHLRPRRRTVARKQTNFGGGRSHPRAPGGPGPGPAAPPSMQMRGEPPMAWRAGPALPHRSQWAQGGSGAPRPPPRGPSRARPARSFLHVGLGRGRHLPGGACRAPRGGFSRAASPAFGRWYGPWWSPSRARWYGSG
jgi:hypothetical protein